MPMPPRSAHWPWFTAFLDITVLGIALFNGSARGELVPFAAQAWGFDPFQIELARWPTLVTGVFLVRNPPMLVGILVFLIVSVGVYESRFGTGRTVVLFGLSHIVTLLATTALLVYPMHFAGMPRLADWAPAGDVGASFGGFGCLGGWIRRREGPPRAWWIAAVTVALLLKLAIYPERFGDLGHLLAFYVGMGFDRFVTDPRPCPSATVRP